VWWVIIWIAILSAFSSWQRPWLEVAGWPAPLVNMALGALAGLALTLPLWWLARQRNSFKQDQLKRWWEAALLALAYAGCAGAAITALWLLFGPHPAVLGLGGALLLFALLLGLMIGSKGSVDWHTLWTKSAQASTAGRPKLLDTSVIIDGRISDLVKTGFIEGKLVLTQFVLQELHAVADSPEPLRRRKGRRGLDILGDLQRSTAIQLETVEQDFPQHRDVDRKLIELAKTLKADLLTTDFNLNKVAKVEGIRVLNINELANAVKPRYLPGEFLTVEVIDRGEEAGQGIGYLDDGTMVVVENGRQHIGKKMDVVVSSTLQTDAGKMLFVRLKNNDERSRGS